MTQKPDIEQIAARVLEEGRQSEPVSITSVEGGKNNQVFKVSTEDGVELILKKYFVNESDTRDRLDAEFRFLSYVWDWGVRNVPQPILRDDQYHVGLYSFVPGRKLSEEQLQAPHIQSAVDFVLAINQGAVDASRLAPASEACFSLEAHLGTVAKRVARLEDLDRDAPFVDEVELFVSDKLLPFWNNLASVIRQRAGILEIEMSAEISAAERCISPSDFGFHNALVEGDQTTFIDFEYAGVDDAAKLVCDFFCQPDIPVAHGHFGHFSDQIRRGLNLPDSFHTRLELLIDAYRVKWLCIMLNDFVASAGARRGFALGEDTRAERCRKQLDRVEHLFSQLEGRRSQ